MRQRLITVAALAVLCVALAGCDGAQQATNSASASASSAAASASAAPSASASAAASTPSSAASAAAASASSAASQTPAQSAASTSADIGLEKAKEIALKAADVTADQVEWKKTGQDVDDGVAIYEVDFYVGNIEWEFDIAKADGSIREQSKEPRDAD